MLALVVAVATFVAVEVVRCVALARGVLDIPNERSSHTTPTPRGGGLGIDFVWYAAIGMLVVLGVVATDWTLVSVTIGAGVVAAVSLIDDLRSIPFWGRLLVHAAAALALIAGVGWWRVADVPMLGAVELGWFGLPLSLVWIVGLTNAYNFMDGIDGIAAAQGIVAGVGWLLLLGGTRSTLGVVALVTAAASLGFMVHNRPPARIFMGDVGSAFLGFLFAALAVASGVAEPRMVLAGVLVVWPFVFDTSYTLLRRLRSGEDVFRAHRSHLYQRLVIAGWSHGAVTLLFVCLAAAGVIAALWWTRTPSPSPWPPVMVLTLATGLVMLVRRTEAAHSQGVHKP